VIAALLAALTLAPGAQSSLTISSWIDSGIDQLTDFRFLPDGRTVITLKTGEVMVRLANGSLVQAGSFPVDDSSEKGLLGVEVHPQFATNHLLFVYYSESDATGGTDVDRHRVASAALGDANVLGEPTILLRGLRGPANHNGGSLAIGPDGKLYVGVGDTGCNSGKPPPPPDSNITNYTGTCLTTANGKILRINLDGSIPADNPLVGQMVPACDPDACTPAPDTNDLTGTPRTEIWAWGVRNPWRFSFDPRTGFLWLGDVGEVTYEEVDIVAKGQHYGWPYREGGVGDAVNVCRALGPGGNGADCVDPRYYCKHGAATSTLDGNCTAITGGVFVDSPSWPDAFRGLYYFGDSSNEVAWTLPPNAARDGFAGPRADFASGLPSPVRFLVGPDGNLYIGNFGGSIAVVAPLPADAGAADAGSSDAGAADAGTGPTGSGGCSCSTAGGAFLPAALAGLWLVLRRRRRT